MRPLIMLMLASAVAAAIAACNTDPSSSQSFAYRYTPQPDGHDTPAGQCVVCHTLEKNAPLRVAPTLSGIVGAKKARFEWFGYSKALANAGGEWSEEDLNEYLTDPDKFLPGTTKTLVGITDPEERAELIDFLKTLKN